VVLEPRSQLGALSNTLRRQFRVGGILALGVNGMVSLTMSDDVEEWRHLVIWVSAGEDKICGTWLTRTM